MAGDCLQSLEEAMDRIWSHQNILSSSIQLSLGTVTTDKGSSSPLPPSPVAGSEYKCDEKGRHHSCRKKRLPRLNIITSSELFKMPPSPLTTSRHQLSSLPSSAENSPQSRNTSRRQPMKVMRSYKSCSELEQDELKGFMDLGFVFQKESLSPRMMSVLPGLQRLGKNKDEQLEGEDVMVKGKVRRPYLSEAWLIRRPDSALQNLKMLPANSTESADMKRQLRFWARTVASTIHQES